MSAEPVAQNRSQDPRSSTRSIPIWVWDVLLILVLGVAALLRFTGIEWDGNQHLHPDERFLTMVETSISPVSGVREYFDTTTSSLNPNNRGFTFYVYGTLPLFIVRYVGEWVGMTGYDEINVVGRVLSGIFDLGTILFVYLIGRRLYRRAKLGLLAALFSALAVLQIQLSHFFTVDNFANFFTYAEIYVAVCIATGTKNLSQISPTETKTSQLPHWLTSNWRSLTLYVLFGIFYGAALASKVSVYALAATLPMAAFLYFWKLPQQQKKESLPILARNLIIAGMIAFLAFRIFQPYTFAGPGFFDLQLNPGWLKSLRELSAIQSGEVDVPYALQWADRPLTFTIKNLVFYGLGIPLGVLSLAGLAWMAWRMVKGDWENHLIPWTWAAFILVTQSLAHVKSMRYVISIYPVLALIAAWAVVRLFDSGSSDTRRNKLLKFNWKQTLAVVVLSITVIVSGLWAIGFTSIYTRPVTRVAASDWIYENIPAAIDLKLTSDTGVDFNQPLAYQNASLVSFDKPYRYRFAVEDDMTLEQVNLQHVLQQVENSPLVSLMVSIYEGEEGEAAYLGGGFLQSDFRPVSDINGEKVELILQQPVQLLRGKQYLLEFSIVESDVFLRIAGTVTLEASNRVQYLPQPVYRLNQDAPYQLLFFPRESGTLSEIKLTRVVDLMKTNQETRLTVAIANSNQPENILASGQLTDQFRAVQDPRGEQKTIVLDSPLRLEKDTGYYLFLYLAGSAELGIYNSITAVESTWDDALPVNLYGYNIFGFQDGLFGNNLNLELYWEDNQDKLDRFVFTLDQADALFISSSRQWGSITRVPERYPLTTEYYRALLGCPIEKNVEWCYSVAKPGMFVGELGFELAAVYQHDPALGSISINDQFSEEAFTVYDHPKVFIFRKTAAYEPQQVREILGAVDLNDVVHKTPKQVGEIKGNLMLSPAERERQTSGGTWSALFPENSYVNRHQWLAAVLWYLVIALLGWIVYPLVRLFLKGLPDRGYPFSRLIGLLLLAYLTWLAGSAGIAFSRLTISMILLVLLVISGIVVYRDRVSLRTEILKNRKAILLVEGIFLLFFLLDLGIRIGNPDLWHPWKGGEKPMDLSYFTAVLKSTTFPPYDPWYSGGYINYYYYGYVIVGVLVKWLGIVPAVAYNLILPTLFAMTGIGAFGIGWNLFAPRHKPLPEGSTTSAQDAIKPGLYAGLGSSLAVLIAGNLGTLRMFRQGFMRLGAPNGVIDDAGFYDSIGWFFSGLARFITGAKLPFGYGEWYWNPSRAIPGDVITEFPFFTFTYADLHAHMIALPITILALGWALSVLLRNWEAPSKRSWRAWIDLIATILFGAFVIATLRPTNTWDLPTFMLFGGIVLFYTSYRHAHIPGHFLSRLPAWLSRLIFSGLLVSVLIAGVMVFYLPFTEKFGQAYGNITAWKDAHSPLGSYLVHWGWQLFLIVSWFIWETREWLAATPASAINKIKPYLGYIQIVGVLFLLVLVLLSLMGISIGWLVGILGVWAAVLLLRPGQEDVKRLVFFMVGTGLILTLFVELFALEGDIGRMNTVFKFYYQAWTLLGLSAAAALFWTLPAVFSSWKNRVSSLWQIALIVLLFGAFLYPLLASADKVRDRMSESAPVGLAGDAYMQTSFYNDQGVEMDLNQDYQAIQWMRGNVQGSPVIVEANTVEYRWGNRYTINTGLPGVLGWNWHQRQQRGFLAYNGIANRLNDIPNFYLTENIADAVAFLEKYHVKYIILGQLERLYYNGAGLDKFTQQDGVYWREVFRFEDTVIYEVIDQQAGELQ